MLRPLLARHFAAAVWVWLMAAWIAATLAERLSLQSKTRWLLEALALLVGGLLLYPSWRDGLRPRRLLAWSALLAAGLLGHALLVAAATAPLLVLAGGVWLLSLTAHSLVFRFAAPSSENSPVLAVCVFVTLCALPVWLGPWIEALAVSHPAVLQALLWLCPLTYLAVLFEYDVLREQWFYQHTPFGLLRYDYPAAGWASLCWAGVAALALGVQPQRYLQPP
jgi:hypothetical protein